jgi:hypothetical protein
MDSRPFLWLLRRLPRRWHRPMAKAAYWCGGELTHVKTYSRFYTMKWEDKDGKPTFEKAGRHWSPCSLSMKFLNLSMQLDWDHWDHWACQHVSCNPQPCEVCGGKVCDEESEQLR